MYAIGYKAAYKYKELAIVVCGTWCGDIEKNLSRTGTFLIKWLLFCDLSMWENSVVFVERSI